MFQAGNFQFFKGFYILNQQIQLYITREFGGMTRSLFPFHGKEAKRCLGEGKPSLVYLDYSGVLFAFDQRTG